MKRVDLLPHQPHWADAYARWQSALKAVLQQRAESIDHFGSTSIPGIHAKPIIDILVARRAGESFDDWAARLAPRGLTHARLDSVGRSEGQWFFRDPPRTVHVHVYEAGTRAHLRHLAFRDALRADAALSAQYDRLKRDIASRELRDMDEYIDAKEAFVRKVEQQELARRS